jgi:ParB-like nuclease domain
MANIANNSAPLNPAGPVIRRLAVADQPVSSLKLNPRNPRLHNRRQIQQLAHSIETFGFNVPVLIDADLNVIAGHGRVMACRQLGWKQVPTICLDHLSHAQARAFMIADNRLTENSIWDERLLAEQFKELAALELDFRLEATGFEMAEIDLRIESLSLEQAATPDPADTPPPSAGPVVTQVGDLWVLGRHRLLCESALSGLAYARLLDGEQAAMVFIDPPYNVPIEGHASGLGKIHPLRFCDG